MQYLICFSMFFALNIHAEELLFEKAEKKESGARVETSNQKEFSKKTRDPSSAKKITNTVNDVSEKGITKAFDKYTGATEITPKNLNPEYTQGIKLGDKLVISFDQRVVAYPGSEIPVSAKITAGHIKGGQLFGIASMNEITKRLVIDFKVITLLDGSELDVKASALAADGSYGIIGDVHSNKMDLFGLDLIFSALKGYSEATKQRNTTSFGYEYENANLKNAEKNAISEASSASIDRIRKEFLSAKEFVVSDPSLKSLVIITQKPSKRM